jgi:DNA-binding NarL/FixJ family response regulator
LVDESGAGGVPLELKRALGYLPTTISPERLVAAIDSALDGVPGIPRSMTAALVRQLRSPGCIILASDDNQGFELSAREWEVLCLMQQGRSTNEIAERLFVSSATVRSHISAIMRKLDVPDRDAALAAVFAS